MASHVLQEIHDDVAILTLNRPEKRNALNPELVQALTAALEQLAEDDRIRAVLITGAGKAFCAGADLAYLKALARYDDQENLEDTRRLATLFQTLYELPKLTLAMVNGPALAGGCGLATLCDFVTAARETARFGYTEVRIGFIPALVANYLIRRVSPHVAQELMMTGRILSADEAHRVGLVNAVFSGEELFSRSRQFVEELLEQNSFSAMMQIKQLTHRLLDLPLEEGLRLAAQENVAARKTPDCQRGLAAFLNKEVIRWRR
ncbi:MAG: enoyl-CoA hydratase/isomerase family protein [Calditrichaeota bacterium]|nr:enoyl-CoA hydratase/isomerase family protein [Calditrichota bacterium]